MTDEQMANFNAHTRTAAAVSELKQIRAIQKQSAAQGNPVSVQQAREALREQRAQEVARTNEIAAAVKAAIPSALKDDVPLGKNTSPIGPVKPPPVAPVADNALVIGRIPRDDDAGGTLTTVNFQVGPMIYQGDISVLNIGPVSP